MKSVWVLQKKVGDLWFTCRDPNGQPLWFPTKAKAEAVRRPLGDRYRVIQVED